MQLSMVVDTDANTPTLILLSGISTTGKNSSNATTSWRIWTEGFGCSTFQCNRELTGRMERRVGRPRPNRWLPPATEMSPTTFTAQSSSRPQRAAPAALPFPVVIASSTAVIHLEYELESLEPPPSGWTRFVCISDTHTRSFPVPPGDVLLHSGDLTNTGTYREFQTTMDWLCGLPHKVKM